VDNAVLFPIEQFFDGAVPLAEGKVKAYEAGTSTPLNMWADEVKTLPGLGSVVTLDNYGQVPVTGIWLSGYYKLIITDKFDNPKFTFDGIKAYEPLDWSGLEATIADLNSTVTNTIGVTGTYNVTIAQRNKTILADASADPVTINLPTAVSVGNKFRIAIKKIDVSVNEVEVIVPEGESIEGSEEYFLYDFNDSIILQSDGSNWYILALKRRGTVRPINTSRTVTLLDRVKLFEADAEKKEIEVKLPAVSGVGRGYRVSVKKVDASANKVILTPDGTDKIDGFTSKAINSQNTSYELISNGLQDWWIYADSGSENESSYPPNFISGLQSWRKQVHEIETFEGAARSSDNLVNMRITTPWRKLLDATWAEGNDQGGRAAGVTFAADKDYYQFLLAKDDGITDIGYDDKTDGSNLLADPNVSAAGYTHIRFYNAFQTDDTLNIYEYDNNVSCGGSYIYFKAPKVQAIPAFSSGTLAPFRLDRVPLGLPFEVRLVFVLYLTPLAGDGKALIHPVDVTITDSIADVCHVAVTSENEIAGSELNVIVNDEAKITISALISGGAATAEGKITVLGWRIPRD
jgi:hypothetical protein